MEPGEEGENVLSEREVGVEAEEEGEGREEEEEAVKRDFEAEMTWGIGNRNLNHPTEGEEAKEGKIRR